VNGIPRYVLFVVLAAPCLSQEKKAAAKPEPSAPLLAYLARTQLEDGSWPSAAEPLIKPGVHTSDQAVRAFVTAYAGWALLVSGSHEYDRAIGRARDYCVWYLTRGHQNAQANPTWIYSGCVLFLAYVQRTRPTNEVFEALASGVRLLDGAREKSGFWGHGRLAVLANLPVDIDIDIFKYRELSAAHNWALIALARARWAGADMPPALWESAVGFYDRAVDKDGRLVYSIQENRKARGSISEKDGHEPGRSATALGALKLAAADRTEPFKRLQKSVPLHLAGAATGHTPLLNLLGAGLAAHFTGDGDRFRRLWADKLLKLVNWDGSAADWYARNGGSPDAETNNLGAAFRTAAVALMLQLPGGLFDPLQKPFTPSAPATAQADEKIPSQKTLDAILARINHFRKLAGLQPVTEDKDLSKGCQLHSDYLRQNTDLRDAAMHEQDSGRAGFSEIGRRAAAQSVLSHSWPLQCPTALVDPLVATLYHRVPLLARHLKRVGIGYSTYRQTGYMLVIDTSGLEKVAAEIGDPILFPPPDQKDVPRVFGAGFPEWPNPVPGRQEEAGYPITIMFAPHSWQPGDATMELKNKDRIVDSWVSSPQKPALINWPQKGTYCLIPSQTLQAGTTYTVTFKCKQIGIEKTPVWTKTWSFTTAPK